MIIICATIGHAFPSHVYRASSRLSSGTWVKVKVQQSGMYMITPAQLRKWGFPDPAKVRVYGYGGRMLPDNLSIDNYVDDLPPAPCEYTDNGLVFFAQGPDSWDDNGNGHLIFSQNYYSTTASYFLSDSDTGDLFELPIIGSPDIEGNNAATDFPEVMLHEKELISAGKTGHTLLGEDFRFVRRQTFNFPLPGHVPDTDIWLNVDFAYKAVRGTSSIDITAGTSPVISTSLDPTGDDCHFLLRSFAGTAAVADETGSFDIEIAFGTSSSTLRLARLDNICINYRRKLIMGKSGTLLFHLDKQAAILEGASEDTRVWDVTQPGEPKRINTGYTNGTLAWTAPAPSMRTYVAWTPGADMSAPVFAGRINCQDLHSRNVPDMVIVTLPQWRQQAEDLADLHRNNPHRPLDVAVVTQDEAFNEFSSGTPDITAIRRMLKMWWDNGGGSETSDSKLRYALMFGRAHYDHRGITPSGHDMQRNNLFQWQSIDGSSETTSYTSDDYLAMLHDGAGQNPGADYHCLAIGRIPVSSVSEARLTVRKLKDYMDDPDKSDWKNRVVMCADDGDSGIHLEQMEETYSAMFNAAGGDQRLYTKVYVDAFPLINGTVKSARERMFRTLNSGALWWLYIGHASATSWTGENLLTLSDITSASFRHPPIIYTASCSFLHWDGDSESGAEMMFFNPEGIIGAIAATRPVYISYNARMSTAFGRYVWRTESDGTPLALGEIMRQAKNSLLPGFDTNKLRYVLLGDPAMIPAIPRHNVRLESVDNKPLDASQPWPELPALGQVTIEGSVTGADGQTDTSFNGTIIPTLFDAEHSTTSEGRDVGDSEGKQITFEEQGERIYVGRAEVTDGRFKMDIRMPSEVADNYRPAALNMYAYTTDNQRDASGICRQLYVYGYADNAPDDSEPPVIELFVLNSPSFKSGDDVNTSPTVIAHFRDNTGINISTAGIGHQISLLLDGERSFPDAAQYYTPGDEGATSGTLVYPLPDISEGSHSLRIRVWDTSNNLAESEITFNAIAGQTPGIIDVFADASPAIDQTNFYVRHNRPDAIVTVTVTIYNLLGRAVWTSTQTGRSDLFTTVPVRWDLTDGSGRRVPRGIYVYRASIKCDGEEVVAPGRKIAVAGL